MGRVRDAMNAVVAYALNPTLKVINEDLAKIKETLASLQVPANLTQRLDELEARPVYEPGAVTALQDALASLAKRVADLEAAPVLSDADIATLDAAREVIAELEEIAAGVTAAPQ